VSFELSKTDSSTLPYHFYHVILQWFLGCECHDYHYDHAFSRHHSIETPQLPPRHRFLPLLWLLRLPLLGCDSQEGSSWFVFHFPRHYFRTSLIHTFVIEQVLGSRFPSDSFSSSSCSPGLGSSASKINSTRLTVIVLRKSCESPTIETEMSI